MRIAFITAGAAGMYCGSCMHDNTLASALIKQGHDALLLPTYTPIRTDEEDVSAGRIFFGGINVYLQQKSRLFRHTPWLFDRLLNSPRLLRWVSRFAVRTQADRLGELTISMLLGSDGKQSKEVAKLVHFLRTQVRPEVLLLSNVLISGMAPRLKQELGAPILAELQGDDIFLEALPAEHRHRAIELIRGNAAAIDGYLTTSSYFADFMATYLGLPRERMHVIYPGLDLRGHGQGRDFRSEPPYTIGYFARISPEKGLQYLVDAYILLRKTPDAPPCRLRISGWLGEHNRPFFDAQMQKLRDAGLEGEVEHVPSPDHAGKLAFLRSLDVLSVPTVYREPKGLYVLEALANGTPVVQPAHGSFPELIEATGGGLLVEPESPAAIAAGLKRVLTDPVLRQELARKGKEAVLAHFTAQRMATETEAVLGQYVK
jgi:glycosyltransferase involved in cell wall biosynthesis